MRRWCEGFSFFYWGTERGIVAYFTSWRNWNCGDRRAEFHRIGNLCNVIQQLRSETFTLFLKKLKFSSFLWCARYEYSGWDSNGWNHTRDTWSSIRLYQTWKIGICCYANSRKAIIYEWAKITSVFDAVFISAKSTGEKNSTLTWKYRTRRKRKS